MVNKMYSVTCILHKKRLTIEVMASDIAKAVEKGRVEFKKQFGKWPEEVQAKREN